MDADPLSLEPLLEAGRLLSSQLELPELLRTVLSLASKVVGAETASLLLLDERSQELYFDVALGLGEAAGRVRLKLGQGVAGCVARDRVAAVINDVRRDARWSSQMDAQSGFNTRSILAVPMIFRGRLAGVLEAINKRSGQFSQADRSTFEAFASQAAVAIENARLFSSLKEESLKLNAVFANMGDAAALCGREGGVLLANPAARRLMGEAAGLREAFEGFAVSPTWDDLLSGSTGDREFCAERGGPKRLVLAGTITRLEQGWLLVFRDETERRQRERLKRTFLSLISHKLKTPLAAVIGFSDVLVSELASGAPPLLKAARTVAKESKKLGGLVDKLLRYTTLESPDQQPARCACAVDALVQEALRDLGDWLSERGASVDYRGAPDLRVQGDPDQLKEVVKNLVENAAKFDPKPAKKIRVEAASRDGQALLCVADTGPGIAPEDQEEVFSRFHQVEAYFTGQVEGLGLGLPYVRKVVESHGGRVELKSRLGAGTTVTVRLPSLSSEAA